MNSTSHMPEDNIRNQNIKIDINPLTNKDYGNLNNEESYLKQSKTVDSNKNDIDLENQIIYNSNQDHKVLVMIFLLNFMILKLVNRVLLLFLKDLDILHFYLIIYFIYMVDWKMKNIIRALSEINLLVLFQNNNNVLGKLKTFLNKKSEDSSSVKSSTFD